MALLTAGAGSEVKRWLLENLARFMLEFVLCVEGYQTPVDVSAGLFSERVRLDFRPYQVFPARSSTVFRRAQVRS